MWQIASAIAGGILGGIGSASDMNAQNKAALKNYKAQIKSLSTNYNYSTLGKRTELKGEYDQARRNLLNISFNSKQNQSAIRAAISETNTEGRSNAKLEQSVEAHDLRTESSVVENAHVVAGNYIRQMEADRVTTISQMEAAKQGYKNSTVGGSEAAFKIFSASMKGAQTGYSFGSMFGGGGGAAASGASFGAAGQSTAGIAGNAGFGR